MNRREINLRKRLRSLAAAECCNYCKGDCLETEQACHLINDRYENIADGQLDCDWFLQAVLPAWPQIQSEVLADLYQMNKAEIKPCSRCGKPFVPASNRQRYCEHCKKEVVKQNTNAANLRRRDKKHSQ